jgi:hypothetical protein
VPWCRPVSIRRPAAALRELDAKLRGIDAGLLGLDLGDADTLYERGNFQIGASVRVLIAMQHLGQLVAGRPAEAFARRVVPDYPEVPAAMPANWLTPGST